ncbi:hypothetical protein [Actinomadura viridis]|uniref:Uncharacterized protein n=1 Tax=Actinomadura viridis TaxID=58110 RepID=A0A931DJU5_9ACTN|nr:hypothetical protein [Actinomadura viridis]MBG6090757.1 hypothetical protein [Actinomadura viridis]
MTVHDAGAALSPMMSCTLTGPFHHLAVHPGGKSVAVLGGDLTVELRRSDGTVRRPPDGGPGRAVAEGPCAPQDSGWAQRGWLQFTADGSYLLFGEAPPGGPARLHLLDAVTLARVDGVPALESATGASLENWGEGVEVGCAAAPSTAVAFATCSGDDTLLLAVAEVVGDRLRLSGAVPGQASFADAVPGERVMGLALPASGELVVLDSDESLSAFRRHVPEAGARCLGSGHRLLRAGDGGPLPGFAARSRALSTGDLKAGLNGPVFTRGRLLAVAVDEERRTADGWDWQTVGLLFLDLRTGRWLDFLELPGAGRREPIVIANGIFHQRIGPRTRILRWLPPAETGA